MTAARAAKKERGPMRSVTQALRALDYLSTCKGGAGVTEVGAALGVHKSTASRLLSTMKAQGYVARDELTGRYSLGIRLVELAQTKLEQFDLRSQARPYLKELSERTEETIHLGIMEQGRLVYIDKIDTTHVLVMRSRIGYRISPHCTALGKAILAVLPEATRDSIIDATDLKPFTPHTITDPSAFREHLRKVAVQGYACDDEEHEVGIRCAAAPIRDHEGGVPGAISVSAPITRMSKEQMEEMGVLVRDVCLRLSASLGYRI
ncbi:MAG: IclR family transcriptional regulator [Bacillota bacterium]|jgi:IclR family KDG regulon transcriptional repressor|nr:IclR family transcriptional regulator [Bacillota bacterium]HHT91749.1 IclR family transcriptional regulator [Bacillota bacterium]